MSTPALPVSSSSSWESLVSRASEEVLSKIQQEKPESLTDTFCENLRFFPLTPSGREVVDVWLESESHKIQVAEACGKDVKDITNDCVETAVAFICLKVEKQTIVPRPIANKTLIIIALGRLHKENGIFLGVELAPGEHAIISGDKVQLFDGGKKGGGLAIFMRLKFKSL